MDAMTPRDGHHGVRAFRASSRWLVLIALAGAIALAGCGSVDSLAGPTWQWTELQETDPARQGVRPNAATYTITFHTDGTVDVQADCRALSGTYTVGVPLDLTVDLATTSAACGDPSLDGIFLENLSRVASYTTGSGELSLELHDDAGMMRFTTAGP